MSKQKKIAPEPVSDTRNFNPGPDTGKETVKEEVVIEKSEAPVISETVREQTTTHLSEESLSADDDDDDLDIEDEEDDDDDFGGDE